MNSFLFVKSAAGAERLKHSLQIDNCASPSRQAQPTDTVNRKVSQLHEAANSGGRPPGTNPDPANQCPQG
jgi:hypothetical protein